MNLIEDDSTSILVCPYSIPYTVYCIFKYLFSLLSVQAKWTLWFTFSSELYTLHVLYIQFLLKFIILHSFKYQITTVHVIRTSRFTLLADTLHLGKWRLFWLPRSL